MQVLFSLFLLSEVSILDASVFYSGFYLFVCMNPGKLMVQCI